MKLRSPPLFWRTLLLIVSLAVASLVAWVPSVRVFEREPRAHQIAQWVVSITHATRIALVYSEADQRRAMLADLFENENLRVVPLEPTDEVEPLVQTPLLRLVEREVQQRLGANTRLASQVNGIAGFWVSFSIDEDAYWVFIDRDLLRHEVGRGWIASALLATVFSLLAAIAIARVVNRPLAELSQAASDLGAGRTPHRLPESGPIEIRRVNESFNRMVSDLEKLGHDRAILLAGVSHDLRTPLTRMRLELEMSDLPEASRAAMIGDLEQMDMVVRQFLDYAMPVPRREAEEVDLSALLHESLVRNRIAGPGAPNAAEAEASATQALRLEERIEPGILVRGHKTELARTIDNLLGNAQRYGRGADGSLDLEIALGRDGTDALLVVADHGPGISGQEIERLVRPFERGEASRSDTTGAGLGLAIVERVARLHGAQLTFVPNTPGGLRVSLRMPALPPAATRRDATPRAA